MGVDRRYTPQELEVLFRRAEGLDNERIALESGATEDAIERLLSGVFAKVGSRARIARDAAAASLPVGTLPPGAIGYRRSSVRSRTWAA